MVGWGDNMTNLICDMHVHTKFSCDSDVELEAYSIEAIEKGIHTICFTDHIDHNKNDYGYGYYDNNKFFNDFLNVKEKYSAKLNILCGIEFSEPHIYQEKLFEYSKLPYDFILGSVHYWYKDMFLSHMVRHGISVDICWKYYWNEVLLAVKEGGFDCLGHMDFPKRYYGKIIYDFEKISEICIELVKKNIVLEINTSTLRKNITETMPNKEILSIYKSCGGKHITIGSDSHKREELSADYSVAKDIIKHFDFEEIIFKQRRSCRPTV